MKVTGYNLR